MSNLLARYAEAIFWLARYIERAENVARIIDVNETFSRDSRGGQNWSSVLQLYADDKRYREMYGAPSAEGVIHFYTLDDTNPSSIVSALKIARENARTLRGIIPRPAFEFVNEAYLFARENLAEPLSRTRRVSGLNTVTEYVQQVDGYMSANMLHDAHWNFLRIGQFIERADMTLRLLDVKYYVLLPSISQIGSSLDNVQWETILRSVAGQRAYRWITKGESSPVGIADFLIFDGRMPRSLRFATSKIATNLSYLERAYGTRLPSHDQVDVLTARLDTMTIARVFEDGLHEFITDFLTDTARLGGQIEKDYRFLG